MGATCTKHDGRETSCVLWPPPLHLQGEEFSNRLKAEYAVPRACNGVVLSHEVTFSFPGGIVISRAESRRKQMGR